MTLNSSVNFYIYCAMCSTFRTVLCRWVLGYWNKLPCVFGRSSSNSSRDMRAGIDAAAAAAAPGCGRTVGPPSTATSRLPSPNVGRKGQEANGGGGTLRSI